MKNIKFITLLLCCLTTSIATAQSPLKELKAGHVFTVGIPDYMERTVGLNSAAIIQYKSSVKDVYGFIIEDNRTDLALASLNFASINEFYDKFMGTFLKGEENKKVDAPKFQKIGDRDFVECDVTYYDQTAKMDIYYLVGIVSTKTAFYKVLSWCAVENKDKFKADFQKIIYSLKD